MKVLFEKRKTCGRIRYYAAGSSTLLAMMNQLLTTEAAPDRKAFTEREVLALKGFGVSVNIVEDGEHYEA